MKRWAILVGIGIMLIIVLADTGQLGFVGWIYDFQGGDKVGHFVLYGVLSLLVNLAALEKWAHRQSLRVALQASAVLIVLIGIEELSQRWFPSRTSSLLDLAASYLGVAVFALVALWIHARRHVKKVS